MSLKHRGKSKIWHYEFEINGIPFRKSTQTCDRKEAEAIEMKAKVEARAELLNPTPRAKTMTIAESLLKDWDLKSKYLKSAKTIRGYMGNLSVKVEKIGRAISDLTWAELTQEHLIEYVAHRRGEGVTVIKGGERVKDLERRRVANATVNHDIKHLRKVFNQLKGWGVAKPDIEWTKLFLAKSGERVFYLTIDQERALIKNLRGDFCALVKFSIASGARIGSTRLLKWSDIDFVGRTITFRKMKGEGDVRAHIIPLIPELAALLDAERGKHPIFVFTFECAKTRSRGMAGVQRIQGERYPFSEGGWRRPWKRALEAAGIPAGRFNDGFCFHDLRHTAGSRITRAKGIAVAQQLLGHSDIATTRRYSHVLMDDVAAAMSAVSTLGDTPQETVAVLQPPRRVGE
jgi:integrase